jgi:hypothetical protein
MDEGAVRSDGPNEQSRINRNALEASFFSGERTQLESMKSAHVD